MLLLTTIDGHVGVGFSVQLSNTIVALNKELEQLMTQTSVTVRADDTKVLELSQDLEADQKTIGQLKDQVCSSAHRPSRCLL